MSTGPVKLAGKFECHIPAGFNEHSGRNILYVGKATAGPFEGENPAELYFNGRSAFWDFARAIAKRANPSGQNLSNLAWTNIFKQGVAKGNPGGSLARDQWPSAVAGLRADAEKTKPSVVVLVTSGYYEDIPREAFDIPQKAVGAQDLVRTLVEGEPKYELWSRPSYEAFPPIAWMSHPQGKSKAYVTAAIDLVAQTAGWA